MIARDSNELSLGDVVKEALVTAGFVEGDIDVFVHQNWSGSVNRQVFPAPARVLKENNVVQSGVEIQVSAFWGSVDNPERDLVVS
ncbi:hypothetical protein AU15_04895 [Marinobacter salarius]|uniref:Uncharacterized protein n=1 Tax=Marinobacter salarius TaxID=1420917 RepID=W5YVD7_9GAMM|nr:hypothetical protein AU15_04895 [Marinobacter salarius]